MPLDPFFDERLRVHRQVPVRPGARHDARARWRRCGRSGATPALPAGRGADGSGDGREGRGGRRGSCARAARSRPARHRTRRAGVGPQRAEHDRHARAPRSGPSSTSSRSPGHPAVRVRIYYPDVVGRRPGARRAGVLRRRVPHRRHRLSDDGCRLPAPRASTPVSRSSRSTTPSLPSIAIRSQVEQAYAALEWLFAARGRARRRPEPHRRRWARRPAANLAAAVTLMNRDRAGLPLRLQVLEVPVVDLTGRHLDLRATRALGIPRPLAMRELRSVARTYLPTPGACAASPTRRRCAPRRTRVCRRR